MYSILLVEDDREFHTLVTRVLSNYKVVAVEDPNNVMKVLGQEAFDLILLDLTLPYKDGHTVLQELQAHDRFSTIPVVCLTGRDQVTDKVTAFTLGADDYIQKPFQPLEFRARIDAKLRKVQKTKASADSLTVGELRLDFSSHRIFSTVSEQEFILTPTEFKILQYLGKHPGNVFSREQLLNAVWGDEGAVFDRSIDVHISSLRKKLKQTNVTFKGVSGVGYKLIILKNPSAQSSS